MALTLLLQIPDLPRFDPATPAAWTLLDNANAILRSGEGALAAVPRADRVLALAPVGHLLFIETALPPVAPAKRDALLRYAIEDKLTIDPSTVHAVVLGKSDSGKHVVAAIDRTWLVGALYWLHQAGLTPNSLVSNAAGIAVAAGEWAIVLDGARGFAKRADGFIYSFDIGPGLEPPFGLALALKEARGQGSAPKALVLLSTTTRAHAGPPDAALAGQWETALGTTVRWGATANDHAQFLQAAGKSDNLLTGEFAPREGAGRWTILLKPALVVLALIAATHVVFTLIDNWRLNAERAALEQEMTQLFKSAFPAARAIVDAPLQMQRNLQQIKRERGMPADTDPQMLLARLTALMQTLPGAPAAVTALTVRDGIATLDAVLASVEQRALLQHAVDQLPGAALGAQADAQSSALAIRVTLRAGA